MTWRKSDFPKAQAALFEAAGWEERIALHQVHPLLAHTVLFGGSYAQAAVSAARRYT